MGRGGRGGGRYTPNDDRSRSMNLQDVCGQAAAANEARQRGDDDWGDDGYDGYDNASEEVVKVECEEDDIFFGEISRGDTTLPFGYDWDNFKPLTKPKVSRSIWDQFSVPEDLILPSRKVANIKWSEADGRYIVTSSDEIPAVLYALFDEEDIRLHHLPDIKTLLIGFGYDVEIEWRKL